MSIEARPSILVLGAGILGLPILQQLVESIKKLPDDVRPALSVTLRPSNPVFTSRESASSADSKISRGDPLQASLSELIQHHTVHPIPIDLSTSSHTELVSLFSNHHTVVGAAGFAVTSSSATGTTFPVTIAHAVLAAGVRRFLPWAFGLDYVALGRGSGQPIFDAQLDVRELLEAQSQTEWCIIPVGIFADLLGERYWGVVDVPRDGAGRGTEDEEAREQEQEQGHGEHGEGILRALGGWDTRITVTTPEDIARGIVRLLFPTASSQQFPHASSSNAQAYPSASLPATTVRLSTATTTYGIIADTIERLLHRRFRKEVWSVPELECALANDPENGLLRYRLVFARGVGTAWDESESLQLGHGSDAEQGLEGIVKGWFGMA